jgi:8-oxo-dGTP diphosphatase
MRNANVSIKLALLTVRGQAVCVALEQSMPPRLPVGRAEASEALDQIARTSLARTTSPDNGYIEQLYTFSFETGRETQIVVSYLALVPFSTELAKGWSWYEHSAAFPLIGHPDQLVLEYALIRLRAKIGYTTIAFHLMPESFSLSDLQQTYESILSRPVDPRNFRRRMVSSGLLHAENRQRRDGSHRPAALYRFSGAHDPGSYLTPLAGTIEATGAHPGKGKS